MLSMAERLRRGGMSPFWTLCRLSAAIIRIGLHSPDRRMRIGTVLRLASPMVVSSPVDPQLTARQCRFVMAVRDSYGSCPGAVKAPQMRIMPIAV